MTQPSTTRLAGRRILVTGGASGIGRATALLGLAEGAQVAILDLRAPGPELGCPSVMADVADPRAVTRAVNMAAEALGGLDGVVNGAGAVFHGSLAETSAAEWQRLLSVNLSGPMNVVLAALPFLRRQGGSVVNVASGAGLVPLPTLGAYGASKAALIMLGKSLAMELAPDGIRVNTVCPGAVDTPLLERTWQAAPDPDSVRSSVEDRYALKRIGRPEELAEAIVFLLSEQSSYVTGSTLAVDGGRTFH